MKDYTFKCIRSVWKDREDFTSFRKLILAEDKIYKGKILKTQSKDYACIVDEDAKVNLFDINLFEVVEDQPEHQELFAKIKSNNYEGYGLLKGKTYPIIERFDVVSLISPCNGEPDVWVYHDYFDVLSSSQVEIVPPDVNVTPVTHIHVGDKLVYTPTSDGLRKYMVAYSVYVDNDGDTFINGGIPAYGFYLKQFRKPTDEELKLYF